MSTSIALRYDEMCADERRYTRPYWSGGARLIPLKTATGRQKTKRWGLLWSVPLFEFQTDRRAPLTLHASDGVDYQPDFHFQTDGGSVPPFLWGFPLLNLSPLAYPWTYGLHDSGFKYGGLWVGGKFKLLSRGKLNDLTIDGIKAEGGGTCSRYTVRGGVAVGSWIVWDEEKQHYSRIQDGIRLERGS